MTKSTTAAESLELSELDRVTAAGELSDADLDQVVGGKGPMGPRGGHGSGGGRGTGGGWGRGRGRR
jgi:hypothetical protein